MPPVGNGTVRALQPAVPFPLVPDLSDQRMLREFVAGGTFPDYYGQFARSLPHPIDDITTDFGDDLYNRMMVDPQVAATVAIFKASIIENGLTLKPAVDKADDPDYELAVEIVNEAERMLDDLETPLMDVLWNLLDCVAFGNKVAEQLFDYMPAVTDGRALLNVQRLKVKPRHSTAFVVDSYLNLVGLLATVPGLPTPVNGVITFTGDDQTRGLNLLPKTKFVIATFRPADGDPRGTSVLRAAYEPWWRKRQVIPEYLRYLAQFAGPSIIGFTPPDAEPITQTDAAGVTTTLTPEQVMLAALQALRNGTAAAFRNGASVHEVQMQGDGRAFTVSLAESNQEITKAVLTQELATEEGRHMARAAAQVHQDVLDTLVHQSKSTFTGMVRLQLLRPWVSYNWSDPRAARLAPKPSLGETVRRDLPSLMTAVAQLVASRYFSPDQYAGLDELMGMPNRGGPPPVIQPPAVQPTDPNAPPGDGSGASPDAGTEPTDAGTDQPGDNRVRVREHTRSPRRRRDQQSDQPDQSGDGAGALHDAWEVLQI